ncbi:MAG: universal stress protein [Verrucomicrobiota bacterium]
MKRFKNLLLVLPEGTPSEAILSWASVLGRAAEAESIDLLTGAEEGTEFYPIKEPVSNSKGSKRLEMQAAEILAGLPLVILERRGSTLRNTLELLSSGTYDLVLTSTHDEKARSLAERLARKSPAGVLAIPREVTAPPSRIIVAIDFSDLSSLCIDWAEAFGSLQEASEIKKTVVHAMDGLTRPSEGSGIAREELESRWRRGAKQGLEELLKSHAHVKDDWNASVIESQLPGADIVAAPESNKETLHIFGSHGRNALSIGLLGSQACESLRHAQGSVLVAKRKNDNLGFVRQLLGLQ